MRRPGHDPHDEHHDVHPPSEDTRTLRLSLRRPADTDVAELFTVYSDPRVWHDDPLLRHTSTARTHDRVQRWGESWDRYGIGLWVVRALSGPSAGTLVGVGGCSLPTATATPIAWNLAFTLRPQVWGQGYAQEVAAAGRACAHALRPSLPVTAVVAARNLRSRRAVERAGLRRAWRGRDPEDPDPTAQLLLYADRALNEDQVRVLTT
ncbi:GNAT family N-acetyltransferase [Kineococcus sp. SYSU DK002]|uniref:GNAT family N-acetyltransferase n=1 Tax=Kineococcus sp. SYSU DK002 TaxID=3383123 RepID=UPI003D7E6957